VRGVGVGGGGAREREREGGTRDIYFNKQEGEKNREDGIEIEK
jgi:hypothetical protein